MNRETDKGNSAKNLVEIDRVKGPVSLKELIKITEPMPKGTIMMQDGAFIVFKINEPLTGREDNERSVEGVVE